MYRKAIACAGKENSESATAQLARAYALLNRFDEAFFEARKLLTCRPQLLAALGVRSGKAAIVKEAVSKGQWKDSGAQRSYRARAMELDGDHAGTLAELQRAVFQDPSRDVTAFFSTFAFFVFFFFVSTSFPSLHGWIWLSLPQPIKQLESTSCVELPGDRDSGTGLLAPASMLEELRKLLRPK
jgi:tetratricopeptide (TPR) repeat protein